MNTLLAIVKISLLWTSPVHSLGLFDHLMYFTSHGPNLHIGLAYQGKDIVFQFITEYSSLTDFGP